MRRDISLGVGKFIDSGAVIPEMEERSTVSPRQLMSPEPKLLVSGTQDKASDGEEKEKEKTKGQEKNKTLMAEDNELRSYVEKITKEVLEKEQATKDLSDESKAEDSKEKSETQQTDPSDKDE
jgi:hypothetical protein